MVGGLAYQHVLIVIIIRTRAGDFQALDTTVISPYSLIAKPLGLCGDDESTCRAHYGLPIVNLVSVSS